MDPFMNKILIIGNLIRIISADAAGTLPEAVPEFISPSATESQAKPVAEQGVVTPPVINTQVIPKSPVAPIKKLEFAPFIDKNYYGRPYSGNKLYSSMGGNYRSQIGEALNNIFGHKSFTLDDATSIVLGEIEHFATSNMIKNEPENLKKQFVGLDIFYKKFYDVGFFNNISVIDKTIGANLHFLGLITSTGREKKIFDSDDAIPFATMVTSFSYFTNALGNIYNKILAGSKETILEHHGKIIDDIKAALEKIDQITAKIVSAQKNDLFVLQHLLVNYYTEEDKKNLEVIIKRMGTNFNAMCRYLETIKIPTEPADDLNRPYAIKIVMFLFQAIDCALNFVASLRDYNESRFGVGRSYKLAKRVSDLACSIYMIIMPPNDGYFDALKFTTAKKNFDWWAKANLRQYFDVKEVLNICSDNVEAEIITRITNKTKLAESCLKSKKWTPENITDLKETAENMEKATLNLIQEYRRYTITPPLEHLKNCIKQLEDGSPIAGPTQTRAEPLSEGAKKAVEDPSKVASEAAAATEKIVEKAAEAAEDPSKVAGEAVATTEKIAEEIAEEIISETEEVVDATKDIINEAEETAKEIIAATVKETESDEDSLEFFEIVLIVLACGISVATIVYLFWHLNKEE